jgi:uncharacterized membrane protein YoaK (UPF0700 family)
MPARRLAHSSPGQIHLALMLALTFSTGIIDAVGYLGLDRVFTGNMTGNVVILGMGLAGAVIGGRVLKPVSAGWTSRSTTLFATVGVLMTGIAISLFLIGNEPHPPLETILTAALAIAMGIQASAARHLAVKDITTVVVTSLITGLAADSRLGGGLGQPWVRRVAALALISAGAVGGALAISLHLGAGVALSAAIVLIVTLIGHIAQRAHERFESATQSSDAAG